MNTLNTPGSLLTPPSRWVALGTLVGLLAVGGCSDAVLPLVTTWEGSLEATTPSGPRGDLAAVSQDGRAQTSLQLTRGQPGATYLWRIMSGSCSAPGDVVGGLAAYPPLVPGADGSNSGQTTLSRGLSPEGPYAGWIYLQTEGGEAPVACGQLERTR